MIEINAITFKYDNTSNSVFENYSLYAEAGHTIMVVGDNGSGKSTLGKLLCGLIRPTQGSISINNTYPFNLKPRDRIKIAYYITQVNQLQFVKSTLQEEIRASEKLTGNTEDLPLYHKLFLPSNRDFNPFELTVNQAWRFTVYLAMIVNPYVLFIDEIPSAVNKKNRAVLELILSLRKAKSQITILSYQRKIDFDFDSVITI